ncbi:MAG: hypothetical protein KF683_12530 [Rubrivivax sp.]|nr:hypothetical protein [Rubrivivax sp.]
MDTRFVRPEDRSRIAGVQSLATGADGRPDCYRSEGFAEDLAEPAGAAAEAVRPPASPLAAGRRATDFLSPQALAALPPRRPWGGLGLARG